MGDARIASSDVTRTADVVMTIVPSSGITTDVYRCNECKALLLGAEDARDHLHWHSKLLHT